MFQYMHCGLYFIVTGRGGHYDRGRYDGGRGGGRYGGGGRHRDNRGPPMPYENFPEPSEGKLFKVTRFNLAMPYLPTYCFYKQKKSMKEKLGFLHLKIKSIFNRKCK